MTKSKILRNRLHCEILRKLDRVTIEDQALFLLSLDSYTKLQSIENILKIKSIKILKILNSFIDAYILPRHDNEIQNQLDDEKPNPTPQNPSV